MRVLHHVRRYGYKTVVVGLVVVLLLLGSGSRNSRGRTMLRGSNLSRRGRRG
jgi:hypothetical protein